MMMSKPSKKWGSKARDDAPATPPSPESVRGRALALLTQRVHARAELVAKLEAWGATCEQASGILDELVERGLQDDGRFTDIFIRSRSLRGYGPLVISQELKQRGVDPELIRSRVLEGDYDWQAEAAAVRRRRFGSDIPTERREQAKQLRFLQYRGFSSAHAMIAVRFSEPEMD